MEMMKIADRLKLFALFAHATPGNGGTSQAVCTPTMKIADSLRLWALFAHATPENGGTSHAACMPMMKLPTFSGSEHFLRTPLPKLVLNNRFWSVP